MINIKNVNKFCNEDISLIENYEKAINDITQTWDCHHRKETDEGLSLKQLKELDLYYDRPASEIIFLTRAEHNILHHKGTHHSEESKKKQSESMKGENHPMYGKHQSEDWKQKRGKAHKGIPLSEEHKRKMSESHKGKHRVYHEDGTWHMEKNKYIVKL